MLGLEGQSGVSRIGHALRTRLAAVETIAAVELDGRFCREDRHTAAASDVLDPSREAWPLPSVVTQDQAVVEAV
jgi:hypothetical protein